MNLKFILRVSIDQSQSKDLKAHVGLQSICSLTRTTLLL